MVMGQLVFRYHHLLKPVMLKLPPKHGLPRSSESLIGMNPRKFRDHLQRGFEPTKRDDQRNLCRTYPTDRVHWDKKVGLQEHPCLLQASLRFPPSNRHDWNYHFTYKELMLYPKFPCFQWCITRLPHVSLSCFPSFQNLFTGYPSCGVADIRAAPGIDSSSLPKGPRRTANDPPSPPWRDCRIKVAQRWLFRTPEKG